MNETEKKLLSVVVSVYNEEESLSKFCKTTVDVLESCSWDYELIFVNDGSKDSSISILQSFALENKSIRVLDFSRNFGHEAAMIAGIDYAKGDGIVCMDADLQHPPQVIPEIIEKFEAGYDVISMIRKENKDAGLLKRITSSGFYTVLNILSPIHFEPNSSDFFALSKIAADVLRTEYRENVRYLRGYVQSIGFNKTTLGFTAAAREGGESKYNFSKLLKFSMNAICSFSDVMLKLGIYLGFGFGFLGIIVLVYSLIQRFINEVPSGYTTLISFMCIMFAILFIIIGILGQYIAVIFAEIKGRPIYIVKDEINAKKENSGI